LKGKHFFIHFAERWKFFGEPTATVG